MTKAVRLSIFTAFTALLVVLAAIVASDQKDAAAAFPGTNGKIAFTSQRDGNDEIYVMNSDGASQINLTNNPSADNLPNWSSDGSKIALGFSHAKAKAALSHVPANITDPKDRVKQALRFTE